MIQLFILLSSLLSTTVSAASGTCSLKLDWKVKKEGSQVPGYQHHSSEFIFLSKKEILVASLPLASQPPSPLHIYVQTKTGWAFDKTASSSLPTVTHPRQIIYKDVIGDKHKEVIISDHGSDVYPFPGSNPIILNKINGRWTLAKGMKDIPQAFTFNSEVLPAPKGLKGLFRANVKEAGLDFYIPFADGWKNYSHLFPQIPFAKACYMTTYSEDFDNDGKPDLFLGGCDQPKEKSQQVYDRILTFNNDSWKLLPDTVLPPRRKNSKWGTVLVKPFNNNQDSKTDLLVASHDYGFHEWDIVIYQNESSPGKIKFKEITIPLEQEALTEGFVNAIEDLHIGPMQALLVEVRSVLRDSKNSQPKLSTRLLVQQQGKFTDMSSCLPDVLRKPGFRVKKLPDSRNKLLLVPFVGDIYSIEVTQK